MDERILILYNSVPCMNITDKDYYRLCDNVVKKKNQHLWAEVTFKVVKYNCAYALFFTNIRIRHCSPLYYTFICTLLFTVKSRYWVGRVFKPNLHYLQYYYYFYYSYLNNIINDLIIHTAVQYCVQRCYSIIIGI